ncbi:outer membrane receptor protein involved in Fe transport [Sphingopyxis italica]|uniref:Outer membrane receptor protein involved in Fe transport n=1 Tax=Sphingopyxis italica TaxID=1129133 RepID=A0A7X5XPV9_9SPHN|nr:TonB-dependent receptor [Sphingopyxis italica]NJB89065.1 outer membrane receptor protein involved in Fe transport [Sphingopyxis italica]
MKSSSLRAARFLRTSALGVSIAMAAVAAPAFAQDAPADTATDDSDNTPIIVTAQGRSQLLSDVPVAISAVSAETLQNSGANDIRQLNQLAPSLLVSSTGSEANGSARIRGIGTVGDNPGLESSVPVFIDGVYRSRSGIGLNELGEIDRIEVQRGPQGTLGGRNSSAGLISIYSKKPDFQFGATGEITYGNYDYWRLGGSVTGPISDTLAARLDGVWVKRDGFLHDVNNDRDINNRDRYFLRGQLLFEPTDALSVRLIADYTSREEECCGATYVGPSVNSYIGNLNNPSNLPYPPGTPVGNDENNIIQVLADLGQPLGAFDQGYSRDISVTPGRSFAGKTKDYGFSGQIDYDFGGATLTSITAYREYRSSQAGDLDYGAVDILYRAPDADAYRQFHTFTQELRLQGEAFDGKFDWLVGGFYANEKLRVRDNLRFGEDYGRFASCRIISGGGLNFLYSPTNPLCVAPGVGPATIAGASGASGPDILAGFNALDGLGDLGSINDVYRQDGENWALFTHNIFHITDKLDFTFGLRYTNDKKKFSASFTNDNTVCTTVQGLVLDDLSSPNATARALAGALIGLSCQGNSTAELNGVSINDKRSEDEFTGTAILSYKPVDDLMVYASYSRGYKAGGFNLDRSALKSPILPFALSGGAQALVGALQFDPETVDSYEIGAKYSTGPFGLGLTFFRSDFSSFQLNTFNGTVFLVQNVNGCDSDLGGGDRDQSKFLGAPNYNGAAATTGACPADDVSHGVRSQGFELEASLVPARSFRMTAGLTYAKTKYRGQLVGNDSGAPLDQALRLLPGNNLSNAPELVATGSVAWTPDIGSSGLTGLVYVDGRMTSDYNTGSDLFPQKAQDGYALFNARLGVRGPDEKWGIELWAQNIFNKQYAQVAFNSPFQEGATSTGTAFADPQYPGGRQIFSQFLAEPRTYGVTLRGKF